MTTRTRWDHDFIREVAQQNEKYKGDPLVVRLTDFISQSVYSSPSHFALEMIQNADDEESTEIRFYFERDKRIVVTNNGKRFSKDDVKTICFTGHSLKKNKKGFFGVGFKSVKAVTDTPQVISGNYNFIIRNYYHPEPCNEMPDNVPYSPRKGAVFVLNPRNKKQQYGILKRLLEETKEYLLLFLDYVKKVYIVDRRKKKERTYVLSLDRETGNLQNSYTKRESRWKVHKKIVSVPRGVPRPLGKEKVKETEMALAFPADSENTPQPQKLFCYLPTNRLTGYPFIVQGDFFPTLGRGNIVEDNPWNKYLLKHLPSLVAEAFENLRNDLDFQFRILSFLPLEDTCHDDLFLGFLEDIHEELKKKRISYTRNGIFKKPEDSISLPHDLLNLFDDNDLSEIFDDERFAISDEYSHLERDNLSLLGVEPFGPDELISYFRNEMRIMEKVENPDWFVSVYSYIWDNFGRDERQQLKDIPFLLSESGGLIYPRDPTNPKNPRLIANQYMNRQTSFFSDLFRNDELIFLHKSFRVSRSQKRAKSYDPRLDKVHQMFEFLGVVKTVEPHHIINQLILPRFEEVRKGRHLSHKKAVLFTKYILENLSYYRGKYGTRTKTDDWDIFSDIRSRTLVLAERRKATGKKEIFFAAPIEVYRRGEKKKTNPERHFRGASDIPFISRKYFSKRIIGSFTSMPIAQAGQRRKVYSWDDFFHLMGCWETPRVVPVSRSYGRYDDRLKVDFPEVDLYDEHDSTRGYQIADWDMPELARTIQEYSQAESKSDRVRLGSRLVNIRESVAKNWKNYQRFKSAEVSYFHYSGGRLGVDSTFFRILKKPWFPRYSDGKLIPPHRVYKASISNRYLAPPGSDFVKISPGEKDFYREIGVFEEPAPIDVLRELERIKKQWNCSDNLPASSFRKMEAFYRFLVEKTGKDTNFKEQMENEFSTKFLIFLPAKVAGRMKIWWHRNQVFAAEKLNHSVKPYSQPLLQEGAYQEEMKEVFVSLGIRTAPDYSEYEEAFKRIRREWAKVSQRKKEELMGRTSYALEGLCELIKNDSTGKKDLKMIFDQDIFLTDQHKFLRPSKIFLKDYCEIHEVFQDVIPTLWSSGEIALISPLLIEVGFKSLQGYVERRKAKFMKRVPIAKDDLETFRDLCEIVEVFIENRFSTSYDEQRENINRLKELDVYTARNIKVTYSLDRKRRTRSNVPVYLSKSELTLSTADNNPWVEIIRDDISRSLSTVFGDIGPHLRPLLNDLHENPEDPSQVIRKYGLEKERMFKRFVEDEGQLVTPIAKEGGELEIPEEEEDEEPTTLLVKASPTSVTPKTTKREEEAFPLETIKGFVVKDIKTGNVTTIRARRRKKRARVRKKPITKAYTPFSSQMVEDIAAEIVSTYESARGRKRIKDVRDDDREGCDLISSGKGERRLIEIKASKGTRSRIKLRPSQYERAKRDGRIYYIYKVENVRKGKIPHIEIVHNPMENPQIRIVHVGEAEIEGWKNSNRVSIDVKIDVEEGDS